jgi:hypothetical protein
VSDSPSQCNSNTHQFFWNKTLPTIVLPGRDPAPRPERHPDALVRDCTEYGCKRRVSNKCENRMCLQSCLQWAMDMYNEGYSPLDSCAAHKTEIEKRVKEEMELAGNLDAAIEEPNEAPQEDWEAYILGPDGEVLPPPPVAPLPPPPPLQRLRHAPPPPQPAPNALLPPPPPQPARVA